LQKAGPVNCPVAGAAGRIFDLLKFVLNLVVEKSLKIAL
jgi:hypothetical protein